MEGFCLVSCSLTLFSTRKIQGERVPSRAAERVAASSKSLGKGCYHFTTSNPNRHRTLPLENTKTQTGAAGRPTYCRGIGSARCSRARVDVLAVVVAVLVGGPDAARAADGSSGTPRERARSHRSPAMVSANATARCAADHRSSRSLVEAASPRARSTRGTCPDGTCRGPSSEAAAGRQRPAAAMPTRPWRRRLRRGGIRSRRRCGLQRWRRRPTPTRRPALGGSSAKPTHGASTEGYSGYLGVSPPPSDDADEEVGTGRT